jgi:thioredoxin 1
MRLLNSTKAILAGTILTIAMLCLALPGWCQSPTSPASKPALYDFGMGMCIPCKDMEKVLDSIKSKYGNQIEVRLILAEKERPMFEKFKIVSVPTQVFLDSSGQEVERHIGFFPEDELIKKLQDLKFVK